MTRARDLADSADKDISGTLVLDDITLSNDISIADNGKAIFGAGSDLQIYHDASDSYIKDEGTGNLYLTTNGSTMNLQAGSDNMVKIYKDAQVEIFHDASLKLATTATGIDVTGTAVTDGLTVAGNVSVDGGTIKLDGNYPVGTGNVALGDTALQSITSGADNTGIGAGSLRDNTTGTFLTALGKNSLVQNTTGSYSTALGNAALFGNTTGGYNTAVGHHALLSNTTASNNTAVGYGSQYTNQTGTSNSSLGMNSLYFNTGSYNTAMGHDALVSNTTASDNTAVGYQAGYSNTTGGANTSVGRGAGFSTTTGTNNTALGYLSLASNTTASGNTAVGLNAGYSNTTGASNTFLGQTAGNSNTTSNDNTYVGFQAGYSRTGSGNTIVGQYAGRDGTTGTDNTFVGRNSGYTITTGSKNTILGMYNGNQDGLDIRTRSNHVILSDGEGDRRFHAAEKGTNIYARKDNRAGGWSFGANIVSGTGNLTITLAKVPTGTGNDEVMFMVDCISVNAISGASGSFLNGLARIDSNGGSETIVQPTKTQCGNNPGTVTLQWDKTSNPYLLQAVCIRAFNYQQFMFQTSFVSYDVNMQVEHGADLETG